MTRSTSDQSLSTFGSAAVLLSLSDWLILGLFILGLSLHALLFTSIGALMLLGRLKGVSSEVLRRGPFRGVQESNSSARNLSDDWRPLGFVHAERNRCEFAALRAQSTQARVLRTRDSPPLRGNV